MLLVAAALPCLTDLKSVSAFRLALFRNDPVRVADAHSLLTFGSILRYTPAMPIQFLLPKKFTRAQIEWRVDESRCNFKARKTRK